MSFASPQFFFLIPILILLGWVFRSTQLWRPLRILLLLLLVAAICNPLVLLKTGGMDLWVLMDRSLSSRDLVERNEEEWKSLLDRSRPSRDDNLHFVDFAAEVSPVSNAETEVYAGRADLTRTGLAIRDTLARMRPERHNRILLFSDGFSTEPLSGVAGRLIADGVPLDLRILRAEETVDYQVSQFELPSRAQPGEPFLIELVIRGNRDGDVPLTVSRGETPLFTRPVRIENGIGRLRFSDRILSPGAHEYTARITPEIDAYPGNNQFRQWIEIVSGPRILLLSRYQDDPLASNLRSQGFSVEVVNETLSLSPGRLTGARAVIFNNVPSYEIPNDFLEALTFYVTEQGGGLLMAGGKNSFGSGGYYQSAVDDLLPVTMELKSEHRRLSVAMAIVMDRSGSMSMITPSGNSKMQLANEGAARAVELLGDMDAVTVYAVDSLAHQVTGLLNVGKSRGELVDRIRKVESMGGGIFVYTGMREAWNELRKAEAGQQHMILFSDAADSEEPGEYKALIEEMKASGATVSVIGLGTRSDPDAGFLEDIASRGEGRIFFTDVPGDLPNIFAQETVTVARSTFIDDPVDTQSTGRWYEFAQRDIDWMPQVDGYNLSYLRDGDEAALISGDVYQAPLVAFGRRGIGKSAAVSFPIGGEFSEMVRSWDQYGDFLQTLNRWIMGEEVPSGIGIRHQLDGTELTIDLLYDPEEWAERFAETPPRLVVQRNYRGENASELVWERLSPGHYSVRTTVREGEPFRGAVQLGTSALPFGPVAAGAAEEWSFDPFRIEELRETARTSGGSELLDLTEAWRKPPAPGSESIRSWFFAAALLLFLLEALATRTGWRLPLLARAGTVRSPGREAKPVSAAPAPDPEVALEEKAPEGKVGEQDGAPSSHARRSRFSRAKKRL